MKKILPVLIVLTAAAAFAQPTPDQTLATPALSLSQDRQTVFKPQEKYYPVRHGRLTLDGAAVEALNAPRHLAIFNPFDEDNFPSPDNTVWADESRQKARGWSLFSIKF